MAFNINEQDIAHSLPENKEVTLDDISSPPLIGKCNNQIRPEHLKVIIQILALI